MYLKKIACFLFVFLLVISLFGCGRQSSTTSNNNNGTTTNNTTLSSITLSSGTLSPSFSTSVANYSASVSNSTSSVTVTPVGSGTIKVNGTTVSSGSTSGSITLSIGLNTITIKAYSSGSTTPETYTVNITRANSGNTYYVSTSGSDSNSGTSTSNAFATPGYGSRQLSAGDTLIILGGTYRVTDYNNDRIIPANSGTATAPIIIRGEIGNRPKLAARNTAASQSSGGLGNMVDLAGLNYIRIENIEFSRDSTASGTEVYVRDCITIAGSPSTNIVLKDLYIHHFDQFGINFQDIDTLTIEDCTIEYCGYGAIGAPDAGSGGGWKTIVIDGCDLSYNGHYYQGGDDSRSAYDRPDGIGLEEGDGPITVNDCLVEHNYGDGIDLKLDNATVTNNIVRNNTANGIKIWGHSSKVENCLVYGTGDGAANGWDALVVACDDSGTTIQFINNTIHDVGTRSAYAMIAQYDEPYRSTPITLVMKNNIFSDSDGEIWMSANITPQFSNNLLNRDSNTDQVSIGGTGYTVAELNALSNCSENITGDPKFVNPVWGGSNGDYTLQATSPAINAGTSSGAPSIDLNGVSRPQGSADDIGAYEK